MQSSTNYNELTPPQSFQMSQLHRPEQWVDKENYKIHRKPQDVCKSTIKLSIYAGMGATLGLLLTGSLGSFGAACAAWGIGGFGPLVVCGGPYFCLQNRAVHHLVEDTVEHIVSNDTPDPRAYEAMRDHPRSLTRALLAKVDDQAKKHLNKPSDASTYLLVEAIKSKDVTAADIERSPKSAILELIDAGADPFIENCLPVKEALGKAENPNRSDYGRMILQKVKGTITEEQIKEVISYGERIDLICKHLDVDLTSSEFGILGFMIEKIAKSEKEEELQKYEKVTKELIEKGAPQEQVKEKILQKISTLTEQSRVIEDPRLSKSLLERRVIFTRILEALDTTT